MEKLKSFFSNLSPQNIFTQELKLKFTTIDAYYVGPYCVSILCLIISLTLVFFYILYRCCRQPNFDKVHTAGFNDYETENHLSLSHQVKLDDTCVNNTSMKPRSSSELKRKLLENSKVNLHYSATYLDHQSSNLNINNTMSHQSKLDLNSQSISNFLAAPGGNHGHDRHGHAHSISHPSEKRDRRSLAGAANQSFHGQPANTRHRPASMAQSDVGGIGTNGRNIGTHFSNRNNEFLIARQHVTQTDDEGRLTGRLVEKQ